MGASQRRPAGAAGAGFSILELVVSIGVLLVLTAISVPSLSRAFARYQMNDAASRLAGTLKLARFEAIRLNKLVNCQIQQTATGWIVYSDVNRNQQLDTGETQDVLPGPITLVPAGSVPDPSPIAAPLGGSGYPLTPISGANASVTFDPRGAVKTGNNSTVYVLYLANPGNVDAGFRAVVLQPSGMVNIWTAPTGGSWTQMLRDIS
ncbi:MAG TPA: GspH/FimT family pseudopilin [Candidatus Dormibacteraeota bacterium]|nr:GspH/FimT family pseudopilin [Candidatus Dormibacteraeota bacterium]